MNNFWVLAKTLFRAGLPINKKKKGKVSTSYILLGLLILGLGAFIGFSMFMAVLEGEVEGPTLTFDDVLAYMLSMTTFFALILSFTLMQTTIFKTKDYEFLESLPLDKKTIVGAKIFAVLMVSIIEDILFMLPTIIMYYVFAKNIYTTIICFIGMFFLSFIPILVSSLLALLITIISSKVKHKNVITIIGYFLFFVFVMLFSMSANITTGLTDYMNLLIPWINLLTLSFDPSKFYFLIIYVLTNIICFVLVTLLVAKFYTKLNESKLSNTISINDSNSKKYGKNWNKNPLIDKEYKMIFNNPTWIINAFIGPVMLLIMGCIILFVNFAPEGTDPLEAEMIFEVMVCVVIGMGPFMNSVASSSSSAFSLEGKNFEILLSYPIDSKEIIKAKTRPAIVIPALLTLICDTILTIIISISYEFNLIFTIQLYLISLMACFNTAYIGTICGLRWAKLDFENQMQVIKQGSATAFTMLFCSICSLFMGVPVLIFDILSVVSDAPSYFPLIGLGISAFFGLVFCVLSYDILQNKGTKLFAKIIER